jgi:hypothetical protein
VKASQVKQGSGQLLYYLAIQIPPSWEGKMNSLKGKKKQAPFFIDFNHNVM